MKWLAYGVLGGLTVGFYGRRYRHLIAVYANDARAMLWPVTAPIEAKIGVRRMPDTFPESWLDKPYNWEEQ